MGETADVQVLVMAKEPVPGRAKTRLSPPLSAECAAGIAAGALRDTLAAVRACAATRRIVAFDGDPTRWLDDGFEVVAQHGTTFNERLAAAWTWAGGPSLQIGTDTPQVTSALLDECLARLRSEPVDAWIGLAEDGGWWALGLRRPVTGMFDGVLMSASDTGAQQARRLEQLGMTVGFLPTMRDIDVIDDLRFVAATYPELEVASRFREQRAATVG